MLLHLSFIHHGFLWKNTDTLDKKQLWPFCISFKFDPISISSDLECFSTFCAENGSAACWFWFALQSLLWATAASEGWVGAPNISHLRLWFRSSCPSPYCQNNIWVFNFLIPVQWGLGWRAKHLRLSHLRLWFRSSCPCPYCRNYLWVFNPCNASNQMFDTEWLQSVRENLWGFLFHLFEGTFCLESIWFQLVIDPSQSCPLQSGELMFRPTSGGPPTQVMEKFIVFFSFPTDMIDQETNWNFMFVCAEVVEVF